MLRNLKIEKKYLIVHKDCFKDKNMNLGITYPIKIWGSNYNTTIDELNRLLLRYNTYILVPSNFTGISRSISIIKFQELSNYDKKMFFNKYAVKV